MKIDIAGLDKAEVLMALYAAARPQGLGHLHHEPGGLSKDEALTVLQNGCSVDYLRGRVIKVTLAGDEIDSFLYDRDNGDGAAHRALQTAGLVK